MTLRLEYVRIGGLAGNSHDRRKRLRALLGKCLKHSRQNHIGRQCILCDKEQYEWETSFEQELWKERYK